MAENDNSEDYLSDADSTSSAVNPSNLGIGSADKTWRLKCSCGEVHTVRNGRPIVCRCGRKRIFGL